jgi:hypothetical protein
MKVLHLTYSDFKGGASRAAKRIHLSFEKFSNYISEKIYLNCFYNILGDYKASI